MSIWYYLSFELQSKQFTNDGHTLLFRFVKLDHLVVTSLFWFYLDKVNVKLLVASICFDGLN